MKVYVHGSGHLAQITREYVSYLNYECIWIQDSDIIWACEDVDPGSNLSLVIGGISNLVDANPNALFLVSSQLPVGTIRKLEELHPKTSFACCPENFRATDTWEAYRKQARFVLGLRNSGSLTLLRHLFASVPVVWTSIESAEMVKHTINAYLGLCIAFINEIKDVCEVAGADIAEVEAVFRTEPRVSPMAPLNAGQPFGGGHIDRDLQYLRELHRTVLIEAIYESNHSRRR